MNRRILLCLASVALLGGQTAGGEVVSSPSGEIQLDFCKMQIQSPLPLWERGRG